MNPLVTITLAAGLGTRMKSARAKVLHELAGRPMIRYVADALRALEAAENVMVVGHQAEEVRAALADYDLAFAMQEVQQGTGHAVRCALPQVQSAEGTVLILYGDVPLIEPELLETFVDFHLDSGNALSVIGVELEDPSGYGRLITDDTGRLLRIVEDRDCTAAETRVREINTGIYAVELPVLRRLVERLQNDNAQNEYYLTDIVELGAAERLAMGVWSYDEPEALLGVNRLSELAELGALVFAARAQAHMDNGVTLVDPYAVYFDEDVAIGPDTRIEPGVVLKGRCRIGAGCTIEAHCVLENMELEDGVVIKAGSVLEESRIRRGAQIGPMAHIRPASEIGEDVRIGNFVEVKKSTIGPRTKSAHLTYLGDAEIGADCNIGCGTITCNYDGQNKHQTVIEDGVFVGSDSQLVAPVKVGAGAYIGSGSTITADVPPDALAVSRARQKVIEGWAAKRRK